MDKRIAFLTGVGLGAGAMFILDPDRGKRRRALMRDQAVHLSHKSKDVIEKTSRDLRNRAVGLVSETKALFTDERVDDNTLVDRIRAELGRYPVHDRSIHLDAHDGVVTLAGDVLEKEVDTLVDAVSSVRGVKKAINNLTVHEDPDGISSLQGEPTGAEARWH